MTNLDIQTNGQTNEAAPVEAALTRVGSEPASTLGGAAQRTQPARAPALSISRRTRSTPFSSRVEAFGVKAYTVYNRMLLPTVFQSVEADYKHLKRHVQVWDVAVERQVEIKGKDADALVQRLTPRDLSGVKTGRCVYIPAVDENGGMVNDPVALKLGKNRWWISIADSDLLFWVKALAIASNFDVKVFEPAVSPLAIQGPKADALAARVLGDKVHDIGFFKFAKLPFEGKQLIVARSGYSKQGGFEIYVEGDEIAEPLWDALFAAGEDLKVRPGCPNLIERIEGGLLSYGNDMTLANTPYECGLGRFCSPGVKTDCIGGEALMKAGKRPPARQIRGLRIAGDPVPANRSPWPIHNGEKSLGEVTSAAWSPDFKTNVAIGMVARSHWAPGTHVTVSAPDGERRAEVCTLPFA
ncbi:MAG: dimethylsulfoniopropionate demethylase [Pseudomonadota bacterium]